jgi:RNA polymerase sigma-70 factor (ECF subfamily)
MSSVSSPLALIRLARLCAYSAQAPEWEQFVGAVMPVVALAVRRVCLQWNDVSTATVNEIVQEVFLKLCENDRRILRTFEDRGDDSFLKLLRVISATVATDHFRRTRAEKRGGSVQMAAIETHVPSLEVSDQKATQAVEWPALIGQLDGLLRLYPESVKARDRNLFWLYYRHGLTAEAISRIPAIGLSAKGVESALGRMIRLLRQTIQDGKPKAEVTLKAEVTSSPKPATDNLPHVMPKSKPENVEERRGFLKNEKGFSSVVAINSMKRP